ncbi:hypothetical protein [Lysobacter enzymogenes]|uniref:hypothetical protein n=1 Tax=Lysobacter enzymogenes TaxID=69 RepID=UPI00111636B5|nr:hypothetical protein [Lysobacter enzymogenes]UZW62365.1 hypothetical protein BV903_008785 [Lysobacter enzymogenes]
MSPALLVGGAPGLTRALFRGGEQGRQTVAQNIDAFRAANTTPTVGQATERPILRAAETALSRLPGGAGQFARKAMEQNDEIAEGVMQRADSLSRGSNPVLAGRAITRGVRGPGGFMERTKAASDKLYRKLDEAIAPGTRVPIGNTEKVLASMNEPIPGAPATSRNFQNKRVMSIEEGLKEDAWGPDAVATRPGMADAVEKFQDQLVKQSEQATERTMR